MLRRAVRAAPSVAARVLIGLPDSITARRPASASAADGAAAGRRTSGRRLRCRSDWPAQRVAVWLVRRTEPAGAARSAVVLSSAGARRCSPAGWFAYNVRYTAQDVYATRDPATYTITGRWLVDHPSLQIHTHPEIFGSPAARRGGQRCRSRRSAPGTLNAQGNHLLPAVLGFVRRRSSVPVRSSRRTS